MMQKASASYRIAVGWLLLVLLIAIFTFCKDADFDSSIIALLPKSQQQPVVQQATDKMAERFSRRLIVMLSGADEGKVRNAIKILADSLIMKPSVSEVTWRIEDHELTRFYDEQYPYRFSVIEQGVRERLLAGDFEQIKQQALIRVFSPLSIGGEIIEDPFGLLISLSQNQKSDLNLELSDALLKVTDTELPTYILMVELATEPYSPHLQREILGTFEAPGTITVRLGYQYPYVRHADSCSSWCATSQQRDFYHRHRLAFWNRDCHAACFPPD